MARASDFGRTGRVGCTRNDPGRAGWGEGGRVCRAGIDLGGQPARGYQGAFAELEEPVIRDLLGELRFEVHAHDTEAAYAAAALHSQTREFGRGLGDRSCMALALSLGVPALTADREWRKVKVKGLKLEHLR